MPGVGGDGEESFGSSLKQDGVNPSRVLKRQAADLLWKREYDVEIGNGQKLRLPFSEPLGAGRGLTLGATAIATRVEYFDAMSTPIALIEVTTQDCGPAVANVSERLSLLAREHRVPASQEIVLMGAEDIGQFQPMLFHHSRRRLAGSVRSLRGWHGRAGPE
jgi:hypothetical protein